MMDEYAGKIYEATHFAQAYRLRAAQLSKWERVTRFFSMGVAPALILGVVKFNDPTVLAVGISIAGFFSLGAWLSAIAGFSFKHDRQLELSREVPAKLDILKSELKRIGQGATWENLSSEEKASMQQVMQKIGDVRTQLEREQIHVSQLIEIKAQQYTMKVERAKCMSCEQLWVQPSEMTESEIKRRLKKVKKNERICPRCCQNLPN